MKTLKVNLPGREYQIDIGLNIINKKLPDAIKIYAVEHVVVVTNTTLQDLYPDLSRNNLQKTVMK